jgi:3-hydroxyacyl-CoA dehydrogenase/enoyl-CoA hydratase/3-hydroxybutyryl-CoA epimerase
MSSPVTHSVDGDGVGWIVFAHPTARANVFDPATQRALRDAIAALAQSPVRGVVIASAKERIFIAGADLNWLGELPSPSAAEEFARAGQKLFDELARFKVPVVCAIDGACAGGGYELALACRWRVASDSSSTVIGLPETSLGIIPGWGGCVRLPRLIGARAALEHILAGELLAAREAKERGLVDEVAPAAQLKNMARDAALKLADSPASLLRSMPSDEGKMIFATLKQRVLGKTGGHEPALLKAIDVVEAGAGVTVERALEIEARGFGDVAASEVAKNKIHVFFLREAGKKRTLAGWFAAPSASPPPIEKVGIVGGGVMGSGLAHWLAAHGRKVILRDVQPEALARGMDVVRGLFDEAVRRGRSSALDAAAGLGRIASTTGWDGFADCDLVIEAIVENVAAKRELFAELAQVVGPRALLATNTSALPIEDLVEKVVNPARVLGMHFFNPVSRMPLVELVIGRDTSAETAARALDFLKTLRKSPLICRSSPGFVVTRVLFFYLNEAVKIWETGVATEALDRALREFGWPMGPLRLIDEVGLDVTEFIFQEMEHYFPGRFARSAACGALLSAGLKGRKGGQGMGFYRYEAGREVVNAEARVLVRGDGVVNAVPSELCSRLMNTMIEEATRCLSEGVVKSPDDVDFAMIMGAGFPTFRGGLMRYGRAIGRA